MSGGVLTQEFVLKLEDNMRQIAANEYQRLLSELWWMKVAKEVPSKSRKEIFTWLLDTAGIEYVEEGNIEFDELMTRQTEFEAKNAAKGLRVTRNKFEDLDGSGVAGGGGIKLATEWTRQQTAQAGYWPQKQLAAAIRGGGSATAYDGQNFFSTAHPVNPFNSAAGTYKNDFTGGDAVPIGVSVTLEEAIENIQEVLTYIASLKMPNGEDPRMLKAYTILHPPALQMRVNQLLGAKFIAQDSKGGGGGSADIEAVVRGWGFGPPICAPELGAGFSGGSDTTYYILVKDILSDDLGAFSYVNREPFAITYYTGQSGAPQGFDAVLDRARELEWHIQGRNVVGLGHPYLIYRCRAA